MHRTTASLRTPHKAPQVKRPKSECCKAQVHVVDIETRNVTVVRHDPHAGPVEDEAEARIGYGLCMECHNEVTSNAKPGESWGPWVRHDGDE